MDKVTKFCKFCWLEEHESSSPLETHCKCSGTNASVHKSCLKDWLQVRGERTCNFCRSDYDVEFSKSPKSIKAWLTSSDDRLAKVGYLLGAPLLIILIVVLVTLRTSDITNHWFNFIALIVIAIVIITIGGFLMWNMFRKWQADNFQVTFS
ncbi:E3 ubiquitin-protein ligase MIR1 [Halotydeus destructor]|nr:E3 ubiquitin-protein ligase MIR1 [Halotydeus destructor]